MYKAKASTIKKAYLAIGAKKLTGSIEYACVAAQREMELDPTCNESIYDLNEAFIIARVLRAQNYVRSETAALRSTSVASTITTKKH
jgi:hypothetical protein